MDNKHYIRLEGNAIKYGFSDAFEIPLAYDICITENGGRQFELLGITNPTLINENLEYLYKYENSKVVNNTKTKEQEIEDLKSKKLKQLLQSSELALKSFKYDSLIFENSGESKSNLMYAQSMIQSNPSQQIKWRALNGTYELNDRNSIMITSSNIADFSMAMLMHNNSVFEWQDSVEASLINARTIEEVEAISTDYNG